MATLVEIFTRSEVRPQVVQACASLIDAEVQSKTGLSALAIKAGYKLVNAIRPSMVQDVVDRLLPEFAEALEPLHAESQEAARAGTPLPEAFAGKLNAEPQRVAAALLSVTDRRAAKASGPLRKTYDRLRGSAEAHVLAAVPKLATTLAPFLG
jgi:hypothetical protein